MFLNSLILAVLLMVGGISWAENSGHTKGGLPANTVPQTPATPQTGKAATQTGTIPSATIPPVPISNASTSLATNCSEKHGIERFVQISSSSLPQAARKGGVFYLSDQKEVPQIFYLSSPRAAAEQVTFLNDGVRYFEVSPDGNKILVATDVGGDEQYNIHLYNVATKTMTPLLVDRKARVESVIWDPKSQWFAYTSNQRTEMDMDLYTYDIATKKSTLLTQLKGNNAVTDISANGQWIAVTNFRSAVDSDVLVWDNTPPPLPKPGIPPPPGKPKSIFNLTSHSQDIIYRDGKFSANSQSILLVSDVKGGISQLYLFSLRDKRDVKVLTLGSWGVDEFQLDSARSALVLTTNEQGYSRFDGYELDANGRKKRAVVMPPGKRIVIRSPSFAPAYGGHGFFYSRSASRTASDIWMWHKGKELQWTRSTHASMDPLCFVEEKLIKYPSFDNRQIPAFLFLPRNVSGPVPFIVYVHGGPESQFRPIFSKIFQYFLERGFGVLAPNVRGSTGYGRDYTLLDNYRLREDSVKDVLAGAEWLLKNQYTKKEQLMIYGGSYGGYVVLRAIEMAPDLFAAAAESVGITNFVTFLKNTKAYRRAHREAEYGPLAAEDFLKSISPITYASKIKTPLLIFHGANDPRVPVSESQQLVEDLKKRNIPVEFKVFSDEGHGNIRLTNIKEQAQQVVYFFEKNIKKGP